MVRIRDQSAIDKLGRHILGHEWKPKEDKLIFKIGVNLTNNCVRRIKIQPDLEPSSLDKLWSSKLTLRIIVGIISSIYDPMGLLTPITIELKTELMKLHKCEGIKWDTIFEKSWMLDGRIF